MVCVNVNVFDDTFYSTKYNTILDFNIFSDKKLNLVSTLGS